MSPLGPYKLEQMQLEGSKLQMWRQQGQRENQLQHLRPRMLAQHE